MRLPECSGTSGTHHIHWDFMGCFRMCCENRLGGCSMCGPQVATTFARGVPMKWVQRSHKVTLTVAPVEIPPFNYETFAKWRG